MPDSDDKKARLEAIRAANRAKAQATGQTAAPVDDAPAPVTEAPAATKAAPAAGSNMSEDKAARLAAIRAANAAKAGGAPAHEAATHPSAADATPAPPVVSPKASAPATPATPASTPARPAAKAVTPARRTVPLPIKLVAGALIGMLVVGLLATTTGRYIEALAFGAVFGLFMGWMLGSWPPGPGDEVTGE